MRHGRRFCKNITKKERIFRRAFNMNRWSMVPPRRINRIIELLEVIKQRQRNNVIYDSYVSGRRRSISPTLARQRYPMLEYSDSEYDSESSDNESVSSNDHPIDLPPPHKRQRRHSSRDSRDYNLESTPETTDEENDDIRDEILSPKSKKKEGFTVNRKADDSDGSDAPNDGPGGPDGPGGSNNGPGGSGGVSGGSVPFGFGTTSRQDSEY